MVVYWHFLTSKARNDTAKGWKYLLAALALRPSSASASTRMKSTYSTGKHQFIHCGKVSGKFEMHLTISPACADAVERLPFAARSLGLKVTHIVLPVGSTKFQPMLTYHSHGILKDVIQTGRDIAMRLTSEGFLVQRTKIETCPDNDAAPKSDAEALNRPSDWHFEHHVKILVSSDQEIQTIQEICNQHHAHWSKNALCRRNDGLEERFITQRFYAVGRHSARKALDTLVEQLRAHKFTILDREEEYVIYDSNVQLDAGWLDTPN